MPIIHPTTLVLFGLAALDNLRIVSGSKEAFSISSDSEVSASAHGFALFSSSFLRMDYESSMWKEIFMTIYVIPLVLLNIFAFAKFVNIIRAVSSTRFFTKKPEEGGLIEAGSEPHVTIQICAYNEASVIEATIDAACRVKWPRDKLAVQVLDDSTDLEAMWTAEARAHYWQKQGVNIQHLTRPSREGYKAGNLKHHMDSIEGEFVAYFDSDHRCEPDFLRKAVPHFFEKNGQLKYEVGLVQTPWSYYNTHANLLAECDSLANDIHHVIEQQARSNCFRCFGFNGTGGIWRVDALKAAGGFSFDTVTEDLDVSYMAAMAGFKFVYLPHFPQLLELPSNILAHKQQKYRWNKGFLQVFRKSMLKILKCDFLPLQLRIEAFFHVTGPVACLIGFVTMLLSPILVVVHGGQLPALAVIVSMLLPCAPVVLSGIIACYAKAPASNGHYSTFLDRTKRLAFIPFVMWLAMGTCIHDTRAVISGFMSNDSTFLRTPKAGEDDNSDDFDFFDDQEDPQSKVNKHKEKENIQKIHHCLDNLSNDISPVLNEMFFIVCGFFFSAYLMVIPVLDLFVWTWDENTPLMVWLLPLSLILPAVAQFFYNGSVFLALNKSLRVSTDTKSTETDGRTTKKKVFLQRSIWVIAAIQVYVLFIVAFAFAPLANDGKASGQKLRVLSNSEAKGYCNWGRDGTAATSTCDGEEQGGEWCNQHSTNCNECGGRWCTEMPEAITPVVDPNDITLPGILLAGVQKSGSTAVAYFLQQAGICLSRPVPSEEKQKKEVHYFDTSKYKNGVGFYSEMFAHCENLKFAADGTPDTFRYPKRVKETYELAGKEALEKLKIVIAVREPVARELSWYNHRATQCRDNINGSSSCSKIYTQDESVMRLSTFSEYADNVVKSYGWETRTHAGLYGDLFEQWFEYFDRKQILVLSYDELKKDESSFLQRVFSFLELEADPSLIESGTDQKNTQSSPLKMAYPPCGAQDQLSKAFSSSNEKFFRLMDEGDEGPPMEQRPFPRFELSKCATEDKTSPMKVSSEMNFFSFDLGGSGLKLMPMEISENNSRNDEPTQRVVRPVGEEINLGRIPGNLKDPKEWILQKIEEIVSINDWPDFAFSGYQNSQTHKLWAKSEFDAIIELNKYDNLATGCSMTTNDVPDWAKLDTSVWCKEWYSADQVLGFTSFPAYQGGVDDGRAHFEGARAVLEQLHPTKDYKDSSSFVFAVWGLGTGQTISWTTGNNYHPSMNQTASPKPETLISRVISSSVSAKPVNHTHEILVDIPASLESKNISLGPYQDLKGELPFWMVLSGHIWSNPNISHDDIREIYKHFFSHQVIPAINRGILPKPNAMVFSGGQQEHFGIAQLLREILTEEGIESVEAYPGGIHCGIARLAYGKDTVKCGDPVVVESNAAQYLTLIS